jgi:hypothetical protein
MMRAHFLRSSRCWRVAYLGVVTGHQAGLLTGSARDPAVDGLHTQRFFPHRVCEWTTAAVEPGSTRIRSSSTASWTRFACQLEAGRAGVRRWRRGDLGERDHPAATGSGEPLPDLQAGVADETDPMLNPWMGRGCRCRATVAS